MANYVVLTGDIQPGRLYVVAGGQSVLYNTVTYTTGQTFRGVSGVKNFAYTGTGTQILNEVFEFGGGNIEFVENAVDQGVFPQTTLLSGFSLEYELNSAEKLVNDVTMLNGFAIELLDYPFYSFEIIEIEGD